MKNKNYSKTYRYAINSYIKKVVYSNYSAICNDIGTLNLKEAEGNDKLIVLKVYRSQFDLCHHCHHFHFPTQI